MSTINVKEGKRFEWTINGIRNQIELFDGNTEGRGLFCFYNNREIPNNKDCEIEILFAYEESEIAYLSPEEWNKVEFTGKLSEVMVASGIEFVDVSHFRSKVTISIAMENSDHAIPLCTVFSPKIWLLEDTRMKNDFIIEYHVCDKSELIYPE